MAKAKAKVQVQAKTTGVGASGGAKEALISTAELRLRPVVDSGDDGPLSATLEESGALGSVRIHVEGLGEYRLDLFVAASGHDGASGGDLLYVEPWRVSVGGEDAAENGEGPIGGGWITEEGEGSSAEDPPSAAAFHFRPVIGFLLSHPTVPGKTYCPLPCWGGLNEAVDFPQGTPCPKCKEWVASGEEPPDPYEGARMAAEEEETPWASEEDEQDDELEEDENE